MDDDLRNPSLRWDDDDDHEPGTPVLTDGGDPANALSLHELIPQTEPEPVEPTVWTRYEDRVVPESEDTDTLDADDFVQDDFVQDDEPFDRPDTQKLGILGGKGVGKTYLFQSMVYRTFAGLQAGALTHYLENDATHLYIALGGDQITQTGAARALNRVTFIKNYQSWQRLAFTSSTAQQWYRLRLLYRTGYLGRSRSATDVEFFDASGELLGSRPDDRAGWEMWSKAYLKAPVMVFCLPLWAAFPGEGLSGEEWSDRDRVLTEFDQVIQNYREMRRRHGSTLPVRSVLALTMADDRRCALRALYERWILPYLDSPQTYLKQLRTGSGVARYLSNARQVSEMMHDEFAAAQDPRIASIPQALDFDKGRPWIVPLSAVDGARLDDLDKRYSNPDDPSRLQEARRVAPVPVHVELPLLVALCEHENALM
jgi:hypothetical protein